MADMRKIIIPLPTGSTPEEKAERAHLLGSRWATTEKGIPNGELHAGRVYTVTAATADALRRKGVARYASADGKPTDEEAPPAPTDIRPGTKEWYALPPEERVGSEEWREAQLLRKLNEAAAEEHAASEVPAPAGEPVVLAQEPAVVEAPPPDESLK